MCEYVDHLHEHFRYPVIIKKASYMPPKVSLARGQPLYTCSCRLDTRVQSYLPNFQYLEITEYQQYQKLQQYQITKA